MNPQERELITNFLQQMSQARAGQRDPEADALIREAVARQPDAGYLLVQRAMALEHALRATQAELDQARSTARGGFMDGANAWGRPAPAATPVAPAAQQANSSWGSGMLGTIATTAAGVVAGSFLFQGIQGLMGHRNEAANMPPPATSEGLLDSDDVADALDDDTSDSA